MLYLLMTCLLVFLHFFRPILSSLLSTITWISAFISVMACIFRLAFFPSGHSDLIFVMAKENSLIVVFFAHHLNKIPLCWEQPGVVMIVKGEGIYILI